MLARTSIYIAELFFCLEGSAMQVRKYTMEKCPAVVVIGHGPSYEMFLIAMLCWSPLCADKLWAN